MHTAYERRLSIIDPTAQRAALDQPGSRPTGRTHTRSRQQSATQRKLDELIRAMPQTDDHLSAVEETPDEELQALADLNLADRKNAVDG